MISLRIAQTLFLLSLAIVWSAVANSLSATTDEKGSAAAGGTMIDARVFLSVTAGDVVRVMELEGYRTKVTAGEDGDPIILSSTAASNGGEIRFAVLFFDCEESRPRAWNTMVLQAGFGIRGTRQHIREVNEWDRRTRFSRAYFDLEGHPMLERDVVVAGGVTRDFLRQRFREWRDGLQRFAERIGWEPPAGGSGATGPKPKLE